MSRGADLSRLEPLAQLLLDRQLADLRAAADRRARSQMQLAALDPAPASGDLSGVAADLVALRYQRWADARRSTLNLQLAEQTADWLAARDAARLAFGRLQALQALAEGKARR
jgi:hypothetical protein